MLLHQCNSSRAAWASLAGNAAASGFHVIALDYRGYGESEGVRHPNLQEQGAVIAEKWPGDVDKAYAWLTSQSGVNRTRIGAAGASCGVNQAAQLARRHPEVRTVVLLSGGVNANAREYIRDSPGLPVLAVGSLDDGGAADQMRWIAGWSRNPATKFVEVQGRRARDRHVCRGKGPRANDESPGSKPTCAMRPRTVRPPPPSRGRQAP